MLTIYKDRLIHIEWTIYKGTSSVREDFTRALVKCFLIGPREKYLVNATAQSGTLYIELPQGLEEGSYSIEAIYVKNQGNLTPRCEPLSPCNAPDYRRTPYPPFKPHDARYNDRCIMRSRRDCLFAITEYEQEEEGVPTASSGEVTLRFNTSTSSYGYDGLSAYEIAVMRGDFNGSEKEFIEASLKLGIATSERLGGIKAEEKTDNETEEAKIDPVTGKLYVPAGKANVEIATSEKVGGIKAEQKTSDYEEEAKIDPSTGKLYIKIPVASSTKAGGVVAEQKTSRETVEVKIDPKTGKLYVEPIGEGSVTYNFTNYPDDEDLTEETRENEEKVMKLADKEYNATAFSGLGRVYLRMNISSSDNVLTQEMINKANTRYIIQYDYDLNGESINLPENSILDFQGGSFKNGILVGNKTRIFEHPTYNIFNDCKIKNFELDYIDIRWTGAISDFNGVSGTDCSLAFSRALENIVKYHLGIRLLVIGSYYIANQVATNMDFNIIGYHFPTRILVGHSNEPDVVEKSPSLLYVKEGITAFELNGLGGTSLSSAHATHISITNLLLKSSGKTSNFFNCTTFGAPSRPGYCQNVEATGFDKVFNFTFKDGANTYGTNYYNFSIGQGCNFYENNESLYAIGRDGTSPSLGGLSVQDGVFEQGGSMNLKNLFGYNRICNNLMEGQENPLSISLNKGNIDICGNYFEACTGKISISSSVLSNRIRVNENYMYNVPNFEFSLFNGTLIGLDKEFSSVSLSNVIVENENIIKNLNANAVKSVYPSKFPFFEIIKRINYKTPDFKQIISSTPQGYSSINIPGYSEPVQAQAVKKDTSYLITYGYHAITGEIGEIVNISFYKTSGYINIVCFGENSMGGIGFDGINQVATSEGFYSFSFILKKKITQLGIRITAFSEDTTVYITKPTISILTEEQASSIKLNKIAILISDAISANTYGRTEQRPASGYEYSNFKDTIGFCFYDTDLGKPIWYAGDNIWKDSGGVEV